MLRLGLAARPSLTPSFLRTTLLCSPPVPQLFQTRNYAKETKGEIKKVKMDSDKVKIRKPRFKSGSRLKRTDWLDTPRKPKYLKVQRPTTHHKLMTLNTNKRITKYVGKLKDAPKSKVSESWVAALANNVKVNPENASTLTETLLTSPHIKQEAISVPTFITFLDLWYRRKDVAKATEVFAAMKAQGKLTDEAYAIFAKTLATRGLLSDAKSIISERSSLSLKGHSSWEVMVNYVAADNIHDGVAWLEDLRSRCSGNVLPGKTLCVIIGWALKHGEIDIAEKYFQELDSRFVKTRYHGSADFTHQAMLHNDVQATRAKLMSEWSQSLRETNNSMAENIDRTDLKKLVQKPGARKPSIPNMPHLPTRLTKEEFKAKYPTPISPRLLRPLIDMEQDGKEIPAVWRDRLAKGLAHKEAVKGIKGLAHKIFLNNKERYNHLKNLLTKLGMQAEELTYIPPPRVKGTAPESRRKKTPVVTKWWKKDRTVFEQKE